MFCSKVPVCSSEDLECVESVKIDSQECIERCDGIIVDAINQNKPKDNSKIEQLLKEYENYKFPNKTDVPFPFSLNSKIVFIKRFYSDILTITLYSRVQVQEQVALCQNIFREFHF